MKGLIYCEYLFLSCLLCRLLCFYLSLLPFVRSRRTPPRMQTETLQIIPLSLPETHILRAFSSFSISPFISHVSVYYHSPSIDGTPKICKRYLQMEMKNHFNRLYASFVHKKSAIFRLRIQQLFIRFNFSKIPPAPVPGSDPKSCPHSRS